MADVNVVVLVGRLTKDPVLKYTPGGTAVADLSLAIGRQWTGQDGQKKEETSFIDVVVWKRQAETCAEYLKKGREICVEGRLQQDRWEAPDGQKRSKVRVVANRVQFLGQGKGAGGAAAAPVTADDGGSGGDEPPPGEPEGEPPF